MRGDHKTDGYTKERRDTKMKKLLIAATIALMITMSQSASAEVINLLNGSCSTPTTCTQGTATGVIGGNYTAIWSPSQPTGTGYIDPFLRVQTASNNNEQG